MGASLGSNQENILRYEEVRENFLRERPESLMIHLECVFQPLLVIEISEILEVEHFRFVIMEHRIERPAVLPR